MLCIAHLRCASSNFVLVPLHSSNALRWCSGGDSNLLGAFIYFHLVSLDVAYQHLATRLNSKEMQIDAAK